MKRFGLRIGQRVVVVTNSKRHDEGLILRGGFSEEGHYQIEIESDEVKGKVIFEFSWIEKTWRFVFVSNPHTPCYKDSSLTFLIGGTN